MMTRLSAAPLALGLALFACAPEATPSGALANSPTAFATGSTFAFTSDAPGLWESNDPSVARIVEVDARRAVVRFERPGTTELAFFALDPGTADATGTLRSAAVETVAVHTAEPLDGARVLVGGSVEVEMVYLDAEQRPLAGAGLLVEPDNGALTLHRDNRDAFTLSPSVAGPQEILLEVRGVATVPLLFDAVADDAVVIALAVDNSGQRCEIVATVTDVEGRPVLGWSTKLQWNGDPLLFGERALACPAAGGTVTARLGAATATLTL